MKHGIGERWDDYAKEYIGSQLEQKTKGVLGKEWGGSAGWTRTFANTDKYLPCDVVEIGCGGGKYTEMFVDAMPFTNTIYACDYSQSMLDLTKRTCEDVDNIKYVKLNGYNLDGVPSNCCNLIWSYDVFLHLEMQNVFSYLKDGLRVLRPGGTFILHQINILEQVAWDYHFMGQYVNDTWKYPLDHVSRRGHIYYSTPELAAYLGRRAGYTVTEVRLEGRDIMVHLRKDG